MLPTFSPDRGQQRNKWTIQKECGPLVLFAELVQKKLLRHHWPCEYHASVDGFDPITGEYDRQGRGILFLPTRGRNFQADFQQALEVSARVVSADYRVSGYADGQRLHLLGPHHIHKGKIRQGDLPPPF